MANPLQIAYRTQKAIGVFDAAPVYEALPGFDKPEGTLRCCVYSPCGRYFAYASNEGVTVVDASIGPAIATLPLSAVYELSFSPLGSFLCTWERPAKDDAGDATKNLKIWRTIENLPEGEEKKPVGEFVQKSLSGWALQYTGDERYCARLVTNEVQFYDSNDLKTVWNKLRAEGVADFAIAPGQDSTVAVFVPERKGQPAAVKVFRVPEFANPISQKTFFKGDKVQLKWNKQGTSLIVLAQTEVDKSNKSYYGETTLYLLSTNGAFDARVSLDKEGPIHDVSWSANSKEFSVVYGYMPAKTTIFNNRAVATHSFPIGPRNTVIFSPTGRFVLVAGFGNLAGQIDVYDLEKDYRKVCTIESGNPSVCAWSPDSRYIMTATTSPRLRVDNGVKLWHVGGGIMYHEEMTELYHVVWRPSSELAPVEGGDPLHPVPVPHSSALAYLGTVKTPSKPVGAYRPPGARGTSTPLHFKREDEGGAAHMVSNGTPSVGPNGFTRNGAGGLFGAPRGPRVVPGAEFVADGPPGADGDAQGGGKGKKKRNRKAKDGAGAVVGANGEQGPTGATGSAGLVPTAAEFIPRNVLNTRSRSRSRSRPGVNNGRGPAGSGPGTPPVPQMQGDGSPTGGGAPAAQGVGLPGAAAGDDSQAAGQGGAEVKDPAAAKKIRSLQKKIRAIEDLEMRLAGGEKLEDTQKKKIATKVAVMQELDALERVA